VARAERAGYTALILTVDLPVQGQREPDIRNSFTIPSHLNLANFTGGPTSGSDHVCHHQDVSLHLLLRF
jgi:isopentenyl diphosphate isomerase/L-lactate dehydrogenase-like FMN-dependent dehydrogenase